MKPAVRAGARRSPCPVAATLDLIGDRWTMLVIRDLMAGKTRYGELAASPERIATNILADRIERLKGFGLIVARKSKARAGAVDYHLTERGRSLRPVLEALRDWGLRHIRGTAARVKIPG